ncbi:MAG: hypothetical protein ACK5IM_06535, partial [Demequina sp.]
MSAGTRSYGNWRRPTTKGLMGLGSLSTGLLLGALVITFITVATAGIGVGLIVMVAAFALAGLVVVKNADQVSVLERGWEKAMWV